MPPRQRPIPVPIPDVLATPLTVWRAAHPDATLDEIERTVDGHLATMRAALISQVAVQGPPAGKIVCPTCGARMHRHGKRTVTRTTRNEGTLTITGDQYRCPACGAGIFPPC